MKLNYINKIKANISIDSQKKSSNILDGTYKSIYRGKSMNFENLRAYVLTDDVKDIDWKSSTRTGTLLVKQFVAEKKHNIMFIMDTGVKMSADTDFHESKKNLALFLAGTIGYLAVKNNDYVGMLFSKNNKIDFKPFKYNMYNLEEYLCEYERCATNDDVDINDLLEFTYKNIHKRMIIFVITDINGIQKIKTNTLKKLEQNSDVLVVNINDNYMFGDSIYDVLKEEYLPEFLLKDADLNIIEQNIKKSVLDKNIKRFKKNNIPIISISSIKQINYKIIELLKEQSYASRN
ncbi:MAG: DUF58 domain-containing protein [Bacilli bacterium]|nr:DUF58 domain-containing protein [Bacilli bacterium]